MGIAVDEDFLLVQKMRAGNEKAFDQFVTKYYPAILKYCRVHIKDCGYAEDMTQETFTRFSRTFREYTHYGKAANYLYVIAANICRDYYRKKKELLLDVLPEKTDEQADGMEGAAVVSDALDRLPGELKEIAVLYFLLDRRQKDIAAILGISLPLVKYRIRKARERLQDYFREEDV